MTVIATASLEMESGRIGISRFTKRIKSIASTAMRKYTIAANHNEPIQTTTELNQESDYLSSNLPKMKDSESTTKATR